MISYLLLLASFFSSILLYNNFKTSENEPFLSQSHHSFSFWITCDLLLRFGQVFLFVHSFDRSFVCCFVLTTKYISEELFFATKEWLISCLMEKFIIRRRVQNLLQILFNFFFTKTQNWASKLSCQFISPKWTIKPISLFCCMWIYIDTLVTL